MSTPKAGRLVRVGLYDLTPGYLGKGNFAIVRLGIHRLTKTSVAVKIVEKSDLDQENLQKIGREIEVMRHLRHPSIIRLFQVMETDAMIYIVTEFASKGDIFDHLVTNGKMSEPEAVHVFAQILSAVKYCHSRGVVHRDLKVENLLLDGENQIKLADFGFSNYYESETSLLSTWCGSPPYAAPELFEGKKYVGPKVDMWSLGVVLYVLVSGTLPFDGPTLMDLRERVVRCQYRVPYFLSQECERLLKGLLVIEPEKRLSVDAVVVHPWMTKNATPLTQTYLEQILNMKDPRAAETPINEATVDAIVREVGVTRETVIESVRQNKCDDVCAVYNMVEYNIRDLERERLQAVVTMVPPSSPTSKTPFFNTHMMGADQSKAVTEVYNNVDASVLLGDERDDRSLSARRHTLGPGQPPKHITHPRPYLIPGQAGRANGILPQTNLTQNLPLVCNLPPESFSVKNPHLLRPPPALQGSGAMGRRASDGGGFYFSLFTKEEAAHLATIQARYSTCEESQLHSSNSSTIDSPRRRRTGLHTVMEKAPEINPELILEVENRMRAQAKAAAAAAATAANNVPTVSTTPPQPPKSSPNKHASGVRARRTGLSTVMEVKVVNNLNPDRISPLMRRSSDCNSSDASPCDGFQAMQEEAAATRLAQNEGASSADSASSGYMSPHFLRPPSPDDLHMQPRRSSDSGVDIPSGHEVSALRNSASVPSQPIQQLYDEMYMDPSSPAVTLNNSRRYSYPNSPVHGQITSSASTASALSHYHATTDLRGSQPHASQLDQRFSAQLKLQHHKIDEEEVAYPASAPRSPLAYKGSITQGVPVASPTPNMSSLVAPTSSMAHSHSFDEAYETSVKPRGISGSATNLSHFSTMEDSDVDYMSLPFTPSTTPRPSMAMPESTCNKPEICVTNVTGDEIKFVFGATEPQKAVPDQEPMDHS